MRVKASRLGAGLASGVCAVGLIVMGGAPMASAQVSTTSIAASPLAAVEPVTALPLPAVSPDYPKPANTVNSPPCPYLMTDAYPYEHDGCVVTVQNWMNYENCSVTVDGYYGPLTAEAVRCFETEFGLTVDGEVGPQVRAEIVYLNGGYPDTPSA